MEKKATKKTRMYGLGWQIVGSGVSLVFLAVICKILGSVLAGYGVNVDTPAINMLFYWFMPVAVVATIVGSIMIRHNGEPEGKDEGS